MNINKYLFIFAGIIFLIGFISFSAVYIILKHYDDLKKNEYSILAKEREVHGIIKKKK